MNQNQPLQLAPEAAIAMKASNIAATISIYAGKIAANKSAAQLQTETVPAPTTVSAETGIEGLQMTGDIAQISQELATAPATDLIQGPTNGDIIAKEFAPEESLIAPFEQTPSAANLIVEAPASVSEQTEQFTQAPETAAPATTNQPLAFAENIVPAQDLSTQTHETLSSANNVYQRSLAIIDIMSGQLEELRATLNNELKEVNEVTTGTESLSAPAQATNNIVQFPVAETTATLDATPVFAPAPVEAMTQAPAAPMPAATSQPVASTEELISFAPPGAEVGNIFDIPAQEQAPYGLAA